MDKEIEIKRKCKVTMDEAVAEERSSAWIEQTSNGRAKFGCKSYRVDVKDAIDDVLREYKVFMEEMNKLHAKE